MIHRLKRLLTFRKRKQSRIAGFQWFLKGKIRVVARIRPLAASEAKKPEANLEILTKNTLKLPTNDFYSFDHIFDKRTSQATVFNYVQLLIQSVLDGFNVSLIAYGTLTFVIFE